MNGIRLRFLTALCLLVCLTATPTIYAQQETETKPAETTQKETAPQTEATQEETASTEWQELKPEDGGFSIELPGKAQHSERVVKPLPKVEVKVNLYLLSVDGGKVAYVVGYHDVQEMPATDEKRREILDGGIKGTMVNVLGKLTSHERGDLDGYKMRTFSYTGVRGQRDIVGDSQLFMVGQRVYQLSIIRLADTKVDEETKKRFFSSFKLGQ